MNIETVENHVKNLFVQMNNKDSLWKSNPTSFKNNFEDDNRELVEKYSTVFNIVFSDKFDKMGYERLMYMLKMAKRVENKDIAEHDASVAVGQRLVDDIVKPQLYSKN